MEAPKVARPLSETSQRQEMVLSNVMVLSHEDQVGPPIAENHSGAPATTAETAAPSIAAESGPARATAFTSQTWTAPDFENSHRDAVGSSGVATTAGVTTTSTRADLFTTPSQPVSRAANQPSDEAEAGTATSVPLDQGSASNPDSDPVATEAQPAQPDPINAPPTITSAMSAAIAENSTGPVYIATATDPDAGTTLTYALSGADAALFDINAQTGEVTFKSSPDFETPRDADGDNVYDVKVSATDGTNTATQDVAITVGNSNEGPTVTSAVSAAVTENSTGTVYTAAATDPDAGTTLTYALSGTDAALFNINAQTGEISFKQGPDFEAAKDAGGDNVYDVKVTASDGTTAATQDVKISVTNTNEGPTITSAAAATVAENTSGVIYMAAATDPDAGTKLSYTLSGNDAALFKIDAQTGEVSFKGAPDYEKPRDASGDNVYDIKVSASDGTTTTTQNVAVTVANVDEGFKVTSDKAISVEENTTGTVYTATAFNEAGGTITYSMSGTDAGRFTINQATGAVAFKTAPDYELPTDVGGNNVYDIKVSATDGKDTVTQDVAISVTDGSEQPILTSATSVNVTENTTGTVYTITSNAPNVTYSLSGADAALFNINEKTGAVSFKVSPDYENAQDAGRNNGYDIVVHASTSGAGANLLVNGSFEADVLAGQTQQRTSLTGWSSLSGDFELWRNYADLLPDVGSQNIELDAGTKTDGIYQDVNTTAGQQYVVSLATMIRPGNTVATAGVEVLWNGVVIGTVSPGQSWADSSFEVFGTGGADRLTIKEPASQGADTGGPLIDNVRLFIPADDENSRSQPVHISLTDVQGTTKDGTSGADTLTGAADNDTLYGLAGADTLRGGAGDDTLIGGAGADKLEGGAGKDTASYETASSAVTANLKTTTGAVGDAVGDTFNSIEHLTGSGFNDTLTGSDVDNILSGGAGVDKIYGGWGYDTLIGGAGADYLDGQQSGDTASYIDSDAAVTINLQTGVVTGGYATGDTLVSIEDLAGSNFNDSLTGNAAANIIEGGRGADALDGGAGLDTLSYQNSGAGVTINMATGAASGGDATGDTFVNFESVQGSRHADDLTGNSGNNALYGGEGDDKLTGGAGADILDGGRGSDTASYATASSGVTTHLALGGTGGDATGDSYFGVENLEGSAFNDTLSGDAGNHIITGGAGADILDGGNGVNTLSYETSGSGVSINLMTGAASGGDAAGDVFSRFQNVTGSSHADTLAGDAGSNVLHGGAGDDILSGGRGNDTLYGDAGADLFIMNVGDGVDTVYGGAGGSWMDSIELRDASGGSYTGGFPTDWTMVLTAGHVTGSTQDSLDLSADASGYLENNDGTRVNFAEIEQIRW